MKNVNYAIRANGSVVQIQYSAAIYGVLDLGVNLGLRLNPILRIRIVLGFLPLPKLVCCFLEMSH